MACRREQVPLQSLDSDFGEDAAAAGKLLQNLAISEPPETILQKQFSIRREIPTASSFACRQQAASESLQAQDFRVIGAGTCGRIYEQPGSPLVIKREKAHSFEGRGLSNDYKMHVHIYNALEKVREQLQMTIDVHIPKPGLFIASTDPRWQSMDVTLFEENDQSPANLLEMERIRPLPKPVREALIDRYCPDNLKDAAKKDRANTDCVVRPYFGQLKEVRQTPERFFNLRNYPMYCDEFEELDLYLSMEALAIAMAYALAIMHWECRVDANGVEFVLGAAPTFKEFPHSFSNGYNFEGREVHFWLLDFNQVREMTMDEAGIDNAVRAFNFNDKYYPRPGGSPE